jgi:cobyrinic acid a,c-diamide synthase
MGMNTMPRVLFAAPKSGSGKTTIVCGMIELCKRRNYKAASFKCGPDYIDPMFHRKVLGIESGNLDSFFTDAETVRFLLGKGAEKADITILEGVMGYYDGLGGQTERASTYEIAKITETPVILVVDGKGASVSLAAVIKGMMEYREDSRICGVLLNRVSSSYYGRLKEVIERECHITVVGYLPEVSDLAVPSRHLGLAAPDEMDSFGEWVQKIADVLEETIEFDMIEEIAQGAQWCTGTVPQLPVLKRKVRLAVARDEAFSFYYEENMELLRRMGAELVYFSPLHDESLPEEIDGIILGGGYPENYAAQLEKAIPLRQEVKLACDNGMPYLAECGGFLYLQQKLEGMDGGNHSMAAVLSGKGYKTERLCRFGYITLESREAGILGEKGQKLKGHEFHYWNCTENGNGFTAVKPTSVIGYNNNMAMGGMKYNCMVYNKSMAAGFPHLYYYSNPSAIYVFLQECGRFQAARRAKAHWDSIAKPIDSLGLLEDTVVKLCRIASEPEQIALTKRALIILCGDHGVVEEGVTQTGKEVTKVVSENFAKGCSTVNYMAKSAAVDVYTVDVGMDTAHYPEKRLVPGTVIDRKIARGSRNIAREPAMSIGQCVQAIEAGKNLVRDLKAMGYHILATGEMGIGNTTPTSALTAVFLGLSADEVTGRGAGLSAEGLQKKRNVIGQIIERIQKKGLYNGSGSEHALNILAEIGGYEIAAMAGVYLGGVKYHIPVVMDGAISAAAALTAVHMDERVKDILIASHESNENSGKLVLKALGTEALIHGRMCLGEGTGAMAIFPILDMALEVYRNMGTFEAYEIKPYVRYK